MFIALFLASFGLGFSLCLVLLGKTEKDKNKKIEELEKENRELKIKYLDKCWNKKDKDKDNEDKNI